ncbi:MAG: hypothetical protein WC284_17790 [Candidimonas sp.]
MTIWDDSKPYSVPYPTPQFDEFIDVGKHDLLYCDKSFETTETFSYDKCGPIRLTNQVINLAFSCHQKKFNYTYSFFEPTCSSVKKTSLSISLLHLCHQKTIELTNIASKALCSNIKPLSLEQTGKITVQDCFIAPLVLITMVAIKPCIKYVLDLDDHQFESEIRPYDLISWPINQELYFKPNGDNVGKYCVSELRTFIIPSPKGHFVYNNYCGKFIVYENTNLSKMCNPKHIGGTPAVGKSTGVCLDKLIYEIPNFIKICNGKASGVVPPRSRGRVKSGVVRLIGSKISGRTKG